MLVGVLDPGRRDELAEMLERRPNLHVAEVLLEALETLETEEVAIRILLFELLRSRREEEPERFQELVEQRVHWMLLTS